MILCVLIILNIFKNKEENIEEGESSDLLPMGEVIDVENIDTFVTVESILNSYVNYNINKDVSAIINVLDESYIKENQIEKENIFSKIEEIQGFPLIMINDMKQKDSSINVTTFFIDYNLEDDTVNFTGEALKDAPSYYTTQKKNSKIVINVDNKNNTYTVLPNYTEENNIQNIEEIKKNDSNVFVFQTLNKQDIAKKYMENFINKIIFDVDNSYNLLEENYKKSKFDNIDNYKKYINEHIEEYRQAMLQKYKVNTTQTESTEYICIDQFGNYYDFYVTSPLQYKVKLEIEDN